MTTTLRAALDALPMPEPVSVIGHGPVMNFTSVQPALKTKPHGQIKCYAEDDVKQRADDGARVALERAVALCAHYAGDDLEIKLTELLKELS